MPTQMTFRGKYDGSTHHVCKGGQLIVLVGHTEIFLNDGRGGQL